MSEGQKRLRIIQAGVGGHGGSWVKVLSDHPDAEAVAVVDVNPAALATAGDALDVPPNRRFDDLQTALAAVECDAVLSVTPPKVHPVHAELAAAAGRHFLVEKPLAEDLAAARKMVERFDAAGLQLAVCQQRRYDADMLALRDAMRQKVVGDLGHGHVDFYIPADFTGSFRETMPHVLLVDMAVHHFDLIRSVTGLDVRRVYATSFNPAWSWYEGQAALKMILTLDDGTAGGLPFSYSGDWSARGRDTSWQGDWRLQCAEGDVRFAKRGGIEIDRGGRGFGDTLASTEFRPIPAARGAQAALLSDFVAGVRNGASAPTSGRDNFKTVAAVFAAVESAETGRAVDVVPLD